MYQEPRAQIVSMYTNQVPTNDINCGLRSRYGYEIYETVAEALTLNGIHLAADAVLLIGEYSDYPKKDRGQKLYLRYKFTQPIVEVFREDGRSVPMFSDKHLSYSWPRAKRMYDWLRGLNLPFMAGSSIQVTVRVPELEIPDGANIRRAVLVGYGGTDSYGFHTLEAMQ